MSELFLLLFTVVGIPVFIAMVQNYMDDKRRSRKKEPCPPHVWVHVIDDLNTMDDILICKVCGSRNRFNN